MASAAALAEGSAFEIVLHTAGGLPQPAVTTRLSKLYDRVLLPEAAEAEIEAEWARRLAGNPRLFNGCKFRFHGARLGGDGRCEVLVGVTDYKTFIGTNLSPGWASLLAPGGAGGVVGEDGVGLGLSNPLGNAAVIECADGRILLLRRSDNVGEFPNTNVFPGGHPEPKDLDPPLRTREDWAKIEGEGGWGEAALTAELFGSMAKEVVEETGIPVEDLGPPILVGFARRVMNHRPVMAFVMTCRLTADEAVRLYASSGVADRFESTRLFHMSRGELFRQVLDEGSLPMPGCHRGALQLYRLHCEGAAAAPS